VGPLVGIAVSSIFFALAHYQGLDNLSDYMLLGWILVVGAINALLVYKTDSVFTSYGSHLAYNLGTVMLILFVA
jgi:membrane protease YdiL (CAAX protease family)